MGVSCAGFLVEKQESVIAGDDQSAARAGDDGADALADIPGFLAAIGRIVAVDVVALDIDVIEGVVPPDRAFAPLAADVSNRFGADHGVNSSGRGGRRKYPQKLAIPGLSKSPAASAA